jgi:hypothetical protein
VIIAGVSKYDDYTPPGQERSITGTKAIILVETPPTTKNRRGFQAVSVPCEREVFNSWNGLKDYAAETSETVSAGKLVTRILSIAPSS